MNNLTGKGVLVMAGGTGGHIFPALAVARELEKRGAIIHWLGSVGGMEQTLISKENIPMHLLPVSGVRGKGLLTLLKAPFKLFACVSQARKVIHQHRIDLVVGFGGFASAPGGIASWFTRTPLVIHEQNAIAGLTNRLLARFARRVCQAFPTAFASSAKVQTTGNPIRADIVDIAQSKRKSIVTPINLLVIGGSRGAEVFNQQLPGLFASLLEEKKIRVRHQSGQGRAADVVERYQQHTSSNVEVVEFISDMSQAYQWADIVVCRAGALTVSELAAIGLPAIFVPYPFAVDDHQTRNAEFLVNVGAAQIVQQTNIDNIADMLAQLIDQPNQIEAMSAKAKQVSVLDATEQVANCCVGVM